MATTFNKTPPNRESLNMGWVENCAKLEGAKKLKWGVFVLSARGNFQVASELRGNRENLFAAVAHRRPLQISAGKLRRSRRKCGKY